MSYTPIFLEQYVLNATTINYNEYKNSIREILYEYGFVIVTGILSESEIKNAWDLLFNDLLQTINEDKLNDKDLIELKSVIKTIIKNRVWPQKSLPGLTGKGFLSTHGLPQGEFAWTLRLNKKTKEIYQYLHNEDNLVVSTDLPFYTIVRGDKTGELWPHADQNELLKVGCEQSYQGILYVTACIDNTSANTVILPKSNNNQYYTLLEHGTPNDFGTTFDHGLYIDRISDPIIKNQLITDFIQNSRRIQVPAGALLIFNSKTIHQGFPGGLRLAQTLCWEPIFFRDEYAYRRKVEAVNSGIGTTHWASLGIHHGASKLRPKQASFNNDFHQCVFPMKKIKPYPVYQVLDKIKKRKLEELEQNINPEILSVL
jgi:hypothetical protein